MEDSLTRQKIAKKYTFTRPKALPITKCINTFTGIKAVFSDPSRFKVIYEIPGYGSPLVFNQARSRHSDKAIIHAIFPDEASLDQHATAFAASVEAKIKEKSWKYPNISGNYVDIVKDVINAVAVHIAADKVTGIPLKTAQNPSGIFTENELFDMLATLNFLGGVIARVSSFFRPPNKKPWYPFLSALTATGRPVDELIGDIISIAIATVDFAHAVVNVIDFYLDDARTNERKAIIELVANKGSQSETLLSGYVREAMRLQPQYSGLWRGAVEDGIIDQGPGHPPMEVKAGDRIYASFRNAYLNSVEFPEPTIVNPTRQAASYYLNGTAFRHCPGEASVHKTIAEIIKVVFGLENVRRAPGDAGDLHRLSEVLHETEVDSFVQRNGTGSLPFFV
ncbi:hypothetical protein C0993_003604 [Termitomyces sp. T159_Od127]|nr:hypothetical protein C0993_003604 [Termitomyces sp. T159_Od127]